jgi:hypothetical protein
VERGGYWRRTGSLNRRYPVIHDEVLVTAGSISRL